MKKFTIFLLCAITAFFPYTKAHAIDVSAASAVLIDALSEKIIYEKNAYAKMPMASTTKIMTAICAIENADLDRKIIVNSAAIGTEGSSIYLKYGEKLTVRELVYGLMLNSGNDAAVAIACEVSGSTKEFAHLMNKTAEKIGAKNTHFENPNGLDAAQHYTTAYDLALISAYAMKNTEFKKIVSTYSTTISYDGEDGKRHLKNHNKLLKMYDGCIGIKTGFTKKSGRCLVSAAEKNGITLIAVTLNAPNDWNDHTQMLNLGFEKTSLKRVITKDTYTRSVSVKNGTNNSVKLVFDDTFDVTQITDSNNKISLKYVIPDKITAPVGYRQPVGKVNIYLNGKYLGKVFAVTDSVVSRKDTKSFKRSLQLILNSYFSLSF